MAKSDIALSAPPVTVAGASILGYTLPEWAAIVTIVYTAVLLFRMLFKDWRDWKAGKQ